MRVVLAAVVLAAFFATPAVAQTQTTCRYKGGGGYSDHEVKQTIRCAVGRWGVPGGVRKANSVARCESGFSERDRNSCCSGVFQQNRRYWPGRFRRLNPHHGWKLHSSVYNARTNVVISIRMAHVTGWGDWSCA